VAFKILSVSFLEDTIDILKFEQGIRNTFVAVGESQRNVDQKTLDKAAKWADQIYINALFPAAEYRWNEYPNVNNRNLKQLVYRHATHYLDTRGGVRVDFQDQGKTMVDALEKRRVSSLAVREGEVAQLEKEVFAKYRDKIQRIVSLPVSLCNGVVLSDKPSKDFMVIWVGGNSIIFAISSSTGDIKIARNIPLSMDIDDMDENDREDMARELDRDIRTTLLLYNDSFDDAACSKFYFLGNQKLREIFAAYPFDIVGQHETFSLDNLPIRNLKKDDDQAYHLLTNLFPGNGYNLVDPAIVFGQRFDRWYRYAGLLLVGTLILTGSWLVLTAPPGTASNNMAFQEKKAELQKVESELYALQKKEIELKRFSGWENFYKNTYTNQPAWAKMFSSLAADIPKEFVVKSVEISPGTGKEVHGWQCLLTGQMKATEWQKGLDLLRDFGTKFHRSPYVDVVDVKYTPLEEERGTGPEKTLFDVVIQMTLTPQKDN
jgi:hypothetical protein